MSERKSRTPNGSLKKGYVQGLTRRPRSLEDDEEKTSNGIRRKKHNKRLSLGVGRGAKVGQKIKNGRGKRGGGVIRTLK